MPRLVYISSLIAFLSISSVMAQEDSLTVRQDMPITEELVVEAAQDTLNSDTGFILELSADYGKGVESLLTNQAKWEFGIAAIFNNRLALVGEYGSGSLFPASVIQNGTYESKGTYYRAGIEYLFTIIPKHQLSIGGMFAQASFADYGTVQIESELWPDVNEAFSRENLSASWAEIIMNTQGPIINAEKGFMSNLYWGIRFRLRIMITNLEQPEFDIYAVPGFGRTYSPVVPAANFFLRYRLKF